MRVVLMVERMVDEKVVMTVVSLDQKSVEMLVFGYSTPDASLHIDLK
jgi:hypothetical protein